MPASLCRAMAVNPSVSRFWEPMRASLSGRRRLKRLLLGFRAASWQHQCLNCGTLMLSVPAAGLRRLPGG